MGAGCDDLEHLFHILPRSLGRLDPAKSLFLLDIVSPTGAYIVTTLGERHDPPRSRNRNPPTDTALVMTHRTAKG